MYPTKQVAQPPQHAFMVAATLIQNRRTSSQGLSRWNTRVPSNSPNTCKVVLTVFKVASASQFFIFFAFAANRPQGRQRNHAIHPLLLLKTSDSYSGYIGSNHVQWPSLYRVSLIRRSPAF